jgi:hypothetical protein
MTRASIDFDLVNEHQQGLRNLRLPYLGVYCADTFGP